MTTKESAVERFRERFTSMGYGEKWRPGFEYTPKDVETFLLEEIDSAKRELIERIEELVLKFPTSMKYRSGGKDLEVIDRHKLLASLSSLKEEALLAK